MPTSSVRQSQPATLHAIIKDHSTTIGDRLFLLDARSDRHLSYTQLDNQVAQWREAFDELDVAPGDRVGLLVPDPLDFSIGFIALLAAGVWVAPLDPTVTFASERQLNDRTTSLKLRFVLSDAPAPFASEATWLTMPDLSTARPATAESSTEEVSANGGVILSSSGTTGTPKIMALPITQLLHTADLIATHHELQPAERGFNPLPLWHINAEVVGLLATLVAGSSLVLEERFHRTGFWALIEKHHITWINAVPAIVSRLSTLREGEIVPPRIRFVRSASAPLSPVLLRQFEENVGVPVIETYGMTEAASQISANPLKGARKIGSVGRAVGVDLRVVPLEPAAPGDLCEANDVGRVEIKGPSVIRHYEGSGYEGRFNEQGWLDTGDLGYLDEDDFLFLVGRSDDVINRSGEKIFPREIEEVILGVHRVVGVAVIGIADDVFGQVPTSFVQLEGVSASTSVEEMRVATKEIQDALVTAFSRARRPLYINVVDRLPTHATGKIQKKVLEAGTVPVLFQDHVS